MNGEKLSGETVESTPWDSLNAGILNEKNVRTEEYLKSDVGQAELDKEAEFDRLIDIINKSNIEDGPRHQLEEILLQRYNKDILANRQNYNKPTEEIAVARAEEAQDIPSDSPEELAVAPTEEAQDIPSDSPEELAAARAELTGTLGAILEKRQAEEAPAETPEEAPEVAPEPEDTAEEAPSIDTFKTQKERYLKWLDEKHLTMSPDTEEKLRDIEKWLKPGSQHHISEERASVIATEVIDRAKAQDLAMLANEEDVPEPETPEATTVDKGTDDKTTASEAPTENYEAISAGTAELDAELNLLKKTQESEIALSSLLLEEEKLLGEQIENEKEIKKLEEFLSVRMSQRISENADSIGGQKSVDYLTDENLTLSPNTVRNLFGWWDHLGEAERENVKALAKETESYGIGLGNAVRTFLTYNVQAFNAPPANS